MLRLAICDDNIEDLSRMTQYLGQYRTEKNRDIEYTAFSSGLVLLELLEKGVGFDIYCLDIIMPGYSGMDLARDIRALDKVAPILFITSSPEYALEGYSVRAANYLLKPITRENLFISFDDLLEQMKVINDEDALIIKSNEGIQKIRIGNLAFAEVLGRTVLYHLRSGKEVACKEAFSDVCEKLLCFGCFVQTHRSYVVNMQYVEAIGNDQLTLQTGSLIPLSQGKAKEVRQQYLRYQMEEEGP